VSSFEKIGAAFPEYAPLKSYRVVCAVRERTVCVRTGLVEEVPMDEKVVREDELKSEVSELRKALIQIVYLCGGQASENVSSWSLSWMRFERCVTPCGSS
jgi:hypothetical protein